MSDNPLKKINKSDYYLMFKSMDNIVKKLKNPLIFKYWKKHVFKNTKLTYTKYKNLGVCSLIHIMYSQCNIDDIYDVFYHCIHMSIDNDVEEYINTLDIINDNIIDEEDYDER